MILSLKMTQIARFWSNLRPPNKDQAKKLKITVRFVFITFHRLQETMPSDYWMQECAIVHYIDHRRRTK